MSISEMACYLDMFKQDDILKSWEKNNSTPQNIINKLCKYPSSPPYALVNTCVDRTVDRAADFTIADIFSGIGGMRLGFQKHGCKTVFSSEIDKFAAKTYFANFGDVPLGDITKIKEDEIPDFDILLAGFPCQPYSKAGLLLGLEDPRGLLFFDIVRIIKSKRPKAFLLENVKNLLFHNGGRSLTTMLDTLRGLNYYVPSPEILNSYNFGVPQYRERIFIVGFNKDYLPLEPSEFKYPAPNTDSCVCIESILEENPSVAYTISDSAYDYHKKRKDIQRQKKNNFGFKVFNKSDPYTSTISARYFKDGAEALIAQEGNNPRMLTPRECARLQGFPDDFLIVVSTRQAYTQFGNAVCVNVVSELAQNIINYLKYHMN